MAATIIITTSAYGRYFFNIAALTNPIFPKINMMIGSWNSIPVKNIRVEKVEIYESNVIVLITLSST